MFSSAWYIQHVAFIAIYTDKAPFETPCRCRRISWLHLEVAVWYLPLRIFLPGTAIYFGPTATRPKPH